MLGLVSQPHPPWDANDLADVLAQGTVIRTTCQILRHVAVCVGGWPDDMAA